MCCIAAHLHACKPIFHATMGCHQPRQRSRFHSWGAWVEDRQMITVVLGIWRSGSFRPCEVQLLQLVKVHQMRNLRSSSNFDLMIKTTFVRIFYSKKLNQSTPGTKKFTKHSLIRYLDAGWLHQPGTCIARVPGVSGCLHSEKPGATPVFVSS